MTVCLDRQKDSADVALSCRRWLTNASPADAQEWPQRARTVANRSSTNQADLEPLAAVRVHTQSVDELLEIRSHGKLIWSASSAVESSGFLLPMPAASIAAELARHGRDLALEIRTGKEELPLSIRLSSPALLGGKSAPKSGDESVVSASDAESGVRLERFTTSALGKLVPTCDSPIATSLCSVLAATSGCIPRETLPERFSLELDVETPYTLIPYRNKPAADGPRYKALGNSMAVPVMRWIGERIAKVEEITKG